MYLLMHSGENFFLVHLGVIVGIQDFYLCPMQKMLFSIEIKINYSM